MTAARPTSEPRLRTGSLRRRTIVAVIALVAALLVVLAVSVDLALGARLRAQIEERLADRAAAAASLVGTVDDAELAERLSAQGLAVLIQSATGAETAAGPTPEQLRTAPPSLLDAPPRPGDGGFGSAGGESEAGSAGQPPDGSAEDQPAAPSGEEPADAATPTGVTVTASQISGDDDLVTLRSTLSDGSVLTLTASAAPVADTLAQVRWVMAVAGTAVLAIAVIAVVLVVRRTLRPLDRVTQTARSIARGDRGRRLRPSRPRTEIGRVATAFDEMLDDVVGAEQQALEAEERMRAFLADAAHELRTPMAGVRAAAETLVRADLDRDEREQLAVRVAREAERASRLVDDLLLMARVDRGLVLHRRPVDLGVVLRAEVERQRLLHPSLRLRVVAPSDVTADVDPDRIAQIVSNLVANAARATGGRGLVAVALAAVGDEALVAVTDDGPGVSPADRERIFERLVRLDAARDGSGAGLGLAIARGIARAHGGDLVCADTAAGARFDLSLPLRTTAMPPRPAASVRATSAAG